MNVVKWRRIAKFLKKEKEGILCLQETHLHESENGFLTQMFRGKIFHAASSHRARGVNLGISSSVPWVLDSVTLDK